MLPVGGAAADGDDQLQESLLGDEDQPSSAPMQPSSSQRHQQQIIHYQPFHLESFIQWVLRSWTAFLSTLSSCLQGLLRGGGRTTLSLVQAQRLEDLQESLAVPYDGQNLQHQQQLQELWGLAFPQLPFPTAIKSNQWKEMGWQSDDPGRDFRGAGLYGLDNLVYLGTHQPALFKQLMLKTQGQRAEWEYPFAVAGLNLTFQVAEVLGVHNNPGQLPKTAAGRAFCELLRDSEAAFEEVYCATFALLDRVWLARKASYMQFNAVMAEVKGHLDRALRRRPKSLAELQEHLASCMLWKFSCVVLSSCCGALRAVCDKRAWFWLWLHLWPFFCTVTFACTSACAGQESKPDTLTLFSRTQTTAPFFQCTGLACM